MDHDEMISVLRAAIRASGTAKAWAEEHGIVPSFVSDVLNKRRNPTPSVLHPLGLEKVVTYRSLPEEAATPDSLAAPPAPGNSHSAAQENPQDGPARRIEEEGQGPASLGGE